MSVSRNVLLIGVGGTGSHVIEILNKKIREFGSQTKNAVTALVFDTDAESTSKIKNATVIPMWDVAGLGAVCDRIGDEGIREWFPCFDEQVRAQELLYGTSQWRKKAFLAFLNVMNKRETRNAFHRALDKAALSASGSVPCEVYVIASLAGGTGCGAFIPIALYAKRYLSKLLGMPPTVEALVACPEIYEAGQTGDGSVKIYANAYAVLRELNAINLVAGGYNRDNRTDKKAPIRFKLGSEDEPNVGVLFDASDEKYWSPLAAPFSKIYLLDKIPGLYSVHSHDIVLANSLYTLVCTEIGREIAGAVSGTAQALSQNGANAVYAGIATVQVHFPVEGILEYLAYEKTRRSCEGEWLTLYRGAERRMKEAEERARENKRRFVRKDGDYAAWMEQAVKEEKEYPVSGITDILEQDTLREDKDGKLTPVLDEFFAALLENIRGRLPDLSEQERLIKAVRVVPPDSFFHPGRGKTQFLSALGDVYDVLLSSYRLLLTEIRGSYKRLIENVLPFDLPEEGVRSNPLSVTENLLKRNRGHIHPVSAMTQLCFLKVAVTRYLNAKGSRTWEDLEKGEAQTLPEELLFLDENPVLPADAKSKKSTYLTKGTQRFSAFMPHTPGEKQYLKAKTHVHTDSLSLKADGLSLFETLKTEAANQLITLVLQGVSERLDKLIEAYRSFFGRFEDAKKGLNDAAKLSLQRDAGISGSVIHVYSDEKAKKAIFADLFEKNGETPEEMRKTNSIAGENVLSIALAEARHALNEESDKEDEGEVFRELFDRMVEGYREAIRKNTAFRELSDYSVLRAMEKAGQKDKGEDFLRKTEELFATAVELSEPSLKLDQNFKSKVGVRAERLLVVMMSKGTARYIRTHEEKFDLSLSVNDEVDEDNLNESAAQVFVSRFISATARCVVTEGIPDNTLYISSQTLNILPLAVSKFDELNAGSMYFRSYETALHNLEAGGTDVWNPHLGFHLHKRGHLPYMNPVKEEQCDKELCKALLYGLIYGKLYMRKAKGEPLCFRYFENGKEYMARGDDGYLIGEKNISMIFSWMREREDFISLWSRAFDSEWEAETQKLPPAESMEELADLKRGLREMPILKALRTDVLQGRDKDGKDEAAPRMCLFDFAYSVKSTEENARDCNDAERILRVAYELLMEVCRRKTGGDDSCFAAVYTAQTDGFYEHFALSDRVRKASGPRVYMERIIGWLDESGLFRRIPDDDRYEKDGKTLRFVPYVLPADIIRKIDKWQEKKEKDDAAEEKAEAADRDETKADNP